MATKITMRLASTLPTDAQPHGIGGSDVSALAVDGDYREQFVLMGCDGGPWDVYTAWGPGYAQGANDSRVTLLGTVDSLGAAKRIIRRRANAQKVW